MPDASWGGDGIWNLTNEWNSGVEVAIAGAGVGGQQALGGAVVGAKRVITEITVRHAGTENTVVTLLIVGGATVLTIDVPAQTTRVWSGGMRAFVLGQVAAVWTSSVVGGSTFVSASGVEA